MLNERSFSVAQRYLFLGLLAFVSILFIWISRNYLLPVLWAVIFAILLHPVFRYISKIPLNRNLAAGITIIMALAVIAAPATLITVILAEDSLAIYQNVTVNAPTYVEALSNNAYVQKALNLLQVNSQEIETTIISSARVASSWILGQILSVGAKTFSTIIKFFIMIYLLFFFIRDGEQILRKIGNTISLGGQREKSLFDRFSLTVKAIFNGTITLAIIQGVMGGVIFWALGIENAVLWGSLMGFLSIIPAVGPSFVWIPTAIILFATGSPVTALIVIAGGVVIGVVDNLLKPVLVGRSTKMPDAVILISILGGIVTFGIAGIILGPVIAALFLSAWNLFAEEYQFELKPPQNS